MSETNGGRASPPGPAGSAERGFYFYILSTPARGLFLGVTKDLARCLCDLRGTSIPGTTPLSGARLVYYESVTELSLAFARKAQLEGWNRRKRWRLIVAANPTWEDLSGQLRLRK